MSLSDDLLLGHLPLPERFKGGASKARWPELAGSSDALALAELAGRAGPVVIITASVQHALRLREEIAYFSKLSSILLLPDWETLPYDHFSPHPDLISERLYTLYRLQASQFNVVIVPLTTALYRLPPPSYLAAHTFMLRKDQSFNSEQLRAQLTLAGYQNVNQVYAPGEYSVRGSLIDLFPMGTKLPYRLDLLDDTLDSMRTFDPDTQRSLYPVAEIHLLPAREFPTSDEGIQTFRQRFRELFEGDPTKSRLYKEVSQRIFPAGIEYYLPLFFQETATLFDYLPVDIPLVLHHSIDTAAQAFWTETKTRYRVLAGQKERPLLPPELLFMSAEEFFKDAQSFRRIYLPEPVTPTDLSTAAPEVRIDRRSENPVHALEQFLKNRTCSRTLIVVESLGRRETLSNLLKDYHLTPAVADSFSAFFKTQSAAFMITVGPVQQGFSCPAFTLLSENELYASAQRTTGRRKSKATSPEHLLRDLAELNVGEAIVHESYGVGRYLGLVTLAMGEEEAEFLLLEYADSAKLYVPVAQLQLISRYAGLNSEHAPLHRLGSGQWEKARRKAAENARDTAVELLNLYAQRAARQGHVFGFSEQDYGAFAAGFGFEETADQQAAIQAVIEDMRSGKPMDRLVCGDVGFGKTEVALRAAFVAVNDGKQVVVLVPTTLLAEQHGQIFRDRFSEFAVHVAELSRFRTSKEQTQTLKGMADGTIDIVIGTHRLVQSDIQFARLGLVIIDEEHRFGVRQKEQLKALRAEVDVLTLTATPIPRTLGLALEGLRDFSVIATAPQHRLAIKTFVSADSDGLIREAVLRELRRGGQVFFLHNAVETIESMQQRLEVLVPEARIGVGHGQMRERELERVMHDFYQQRFHLLLCTTIIETGIDVPNANTIIINRADKFGLAQLHQLRGRVGRSHHQAYAYLLTPDNITPNALKRLEAIQMMEELGSGFYLAMHDLEIRGAGEVLGEGQSGQVQEIGFTLYTEMLGHAVKALKHGETPDLSSSLDITTEINLHASALLPQDLCPDVHERLVLYKKFANCKAEAEIDDLEEALIDRFGRLPGPAQLFVESHRLRLQAKALGIIKVDATESGLNLQFVPHPPFEHTRLLTLLQTRQDYRLAGPDRLKIAAPLADSKARIALIRNFFDLLT